MTKYYLIGHGHADLYPAKYKSLAAAKRRARELSQSTSSVMGCNVYNHNLTMIAGYDDGRQSFIKKIG